MNNSHQLADLFEHYKSSTRDHAYTSSGIWKKSGLFQYQFQGYSYITAALCALKNYLLHAMSRCQRQNMYYCVFHNSNVIRALSSCNPQSQSGKSESRWMSLLENWYKNSWITIKLRCLNANWREYWFLLCYTVWMCMFILVSHLTKNLFSYYGRFRLYQYWVCQKKARFHYQKVLILITSKELTDMQRQDEQDFIGEMSVC